MEVRYVAPTVPDGRFRRVNLYRICFGYVLGSHIGLIETVVYVAHEDPARALSWLASQKDYPGCLIRCLKLEQENILVAPETEWIGVVE